MIGRTTNEKDKTLLRVSDLTARWSISKSKLYQMLESGELRSVKIGSSRRIPLAAIEEFESGRTTETEQA